jgi:hypothetical protein
LALTDQCLQPLPDLQLTRRPATLDQTIPTRSAAPDPAGSIPASLNRRIHTTLLAVYATTAIGLMGLVGADSYLTFPRLTAEYAQVRYMLPLLPLFGAALALAARGAGRRWGPAVGALIVVLFMAHDVFSQLLVVGRYYG